MAEELERLLALLAFVRALAGVDALVHLHLVRRREDFPAPFAFVIADVVLVQRFQALAFLLRDRLVRSFASFDFALRFDLRGVASFATSRRHELNQLQFPPQARVPKPKHLVDLPPTLLAYQHIFRELGKVLKKNDVRCVQVFPGGVTISGIVVVSFS